MVLQDIENKKESQKDDPIHLIQVELDEVNRTLKEINLMLEQSRVEVGKLTQRNAAVTSNIQQIQAQAADLPIDEIRQAYDSAMDAQQRLFVMRGQLDKLHSEQSHLERYKLFLNQLQAACNFSVGGAKGEKSSMASVEMLVTTQEAERQRLSRQMHDGPAQALSNFILQTEIAMRLMDMDAKQAREELEGLKTAAMNTFQKIRNFIFELRPMMLDDLGLIPTIRRYADTVKEQTEVEVSVAVVGNERRYESYMEVMVFRAIQEILGIAVNQNQATNVKIQLDMGDTLIRLSVEDNGKGFSTDTLSKEGNLGLKLIKERAELLGGSFTVDTSPGMGSRLSCSLPVHK